MHPDPPGPRGRHGAGEHPPGHGPGPGAGEEELREGVSARRRQGADPVSNPGAAAASDG